VGIKETRETEGDRVKQSRVYWVRGGGVQVSHFEWDTHVVTSKEACAETLFCKLKSCRNQDR